MELVDTKGIGSPQNRPPLEFTGKCDKWAVNLELENFNLMEDALEKKLIPESLKVCSLLSFQY